MVKFIGLLLIATSLLALVAGAFIDIKYGSHSQVTGNLVLNIITQPPIPMWSYDYLVGVAISYSIVSIIIGLIFLFRV